MTLLPTLMGGKSPPMKRHKLSEEVARHIEAAISSGEYQAGDRLPSERDLMEHFGVGRPSIREALFSLRRMGLIELKTGERARVVTPTPGALVGELSGVVHHLLAAPGGMRSFQHARAIFESALAEYAARNATPEDISALQAALRANEAALGDRQGFVRSDVAFHFTVAQIARNPIITALHVGIVEWLAEQRLISIHASGSVQAAMDAHTRIFEAIADRDPMRAAEAMRQHLAEVETYYWSAFQEDEADSGGAQ